MSRLMGMSILRGLLAATLVWAAGAEAAAPAGGEFVVKQAEGAPTVSVGGTVIPYKEVTLAAQLPGRVKYLAGIEGDAFKKGDLLVALDDRELLANRQALLAQMASADAQLRNAGIQYNREIFSPRSRTPPGGMAIPNLFDQMFTRPMEDFIGDRAQGAELTADLYSSGVQVEQARSAIMRLQAELQALDSKLRDARSIAPFDGVIVKKFIEVGDTLQPGQPLLNFADVEYLQVEVDVPARLRPGLQEGMMLQAQLDVDNRVVPARVAQIFPMADAQRHTVTVKFDIPEGTSAAPGMYVNVNVPDVSAPSRSLPYIPVVAVRYLGSLPGVYVLNEQGQPELRLIRLGERLDDNYTTVLSGLNAGEVILTNPSTAGGTHWGPAGGTPGGGPTSGAR